LLPKSPSKASTNPGAIQSPVLDRTQQRSERKQC
jgi:hypothetical protein